MNSFSEIINWNALYVLNLEGNMFKHVPHAICNLKSLQELILDKNHISILPISIVRQKYITIHICLVRKIL